MCGDQFTIRKVSFQRWFARGGKKPAKVNNLLPKQIKLNRPCAWIYQFYLFTQIYISHHILQKSVTKMVAEIIVKAKVKAVKWVAMSVGITSLASTTSCCNIAI